MSNTTATAACISLRKREGSPQKAMDPLRLLHPGIAAAFHMPISEVATRLSQSPHFRFPSDLVIFVIALNTDKYSPVFDSSMEVFDHQIRAVDCRSASSFPRCTGLINGIESSIVAVPDL